ncbi:2,3-diaminopropionate biosynthesis protein SbnA [Amycolatopsis vastitatis]|uniref:2,3-diaminopropionate biosynthesis protein SbnA n=1 Tax=Amycolatopsis vastitatis TaxID=1905142 RepID=A0A229T1Q1_9PSEU|nr:2,3-diaminopropionate biosynthesis protein SbnA [Amycolatopsis vastitatis]OXM65195.1 2,3-diaminopropionate biosynthesis protein SbnA [Amycolatopsis vastitatis]
MPVIVTPQEFNVERLFVDLTPHFGHRLYLKCEGFNFAGSIKLKAATEMVDTAERSGALVPGATLVESSSGNLGVALSLVARSRGYRFVCVTDSRCTLTSRQLMQVLGAEVRMVTDPDPVEGFLGARLQEVRRLCAENAGYTWLNQYANPGNWMAHYRTTGPQILAEFPDVEVLFIGAGTVGTLMGCARFFRKAKPSVHVVAVDSVGSVTFGAPAGPRMIPGLGMGVRPMLLDESYVDEVVLVPEIETVRMARSLAQCGFLFGGSTGTVLSGAMEWLADHPRHAKSTTVAISPDLGDRYLDTVYQDQWVTDIYGAEALDHRLSEVPR